MNEHEKMQYIRSLSDQIRSTLSNVSAVFAPSCMSHIMLTKPDWHKVAIRGTSLPDALQCWEASPRTIAETSNQNSRFSPPYYSESIMNQYSPYGQMPHSQMQPITNKLKTSYHQKPGHENKNTPFELNGKSTSQEDNVDDELSQFYLNHGQQSAHLSGANEETNNRGSSKSSSQPVYSNLQLSHDHSVDLSNQGEPKVTIIHYKEVNASPTPATTTTATVVTPSVLQEPTSSRSTLPLSEVEASIASNENSISQQIVPSSTSMPITTVFPTTAATKRDMSSKKRRKRKRRKNHNQRRGSGSGKSKREPNTKQSPPPHLPLAYAGRVVVHHRPSRYLFDAQLMNDGGASSHNSPSSSFHWTNYGINLNDALASYQLQQQAQNAHYRSQPMCEFRLIDDHTAPQSNSETGRFRNNYYANNYDCPRFYKSYMD